MTKKLFIKTYGCQMNVYDSERMAEALGGQGYVETKTPEDADMILLNTCHIREKAAEKVYSELGRLKPLKDLNPDLKIGVAGCVAQAEGEEITRRQPAVDLVVGPQTYHRLPEMEARVRAGKPALDTDFPAEDKFDHLKGRPKARRAPAAFLTVQEGCDKFCAFCVVPLHTWRGSLAPRDPGAGRGPRPGGAGRARGDPAGPECERLPRRHDPGGADPGTGPHGRAGAYPLHHIPPQ